MNNANYSIKLISNRMLNIFNKILDCFSFSCSPRIKTYHYTHDDSNCVVKEEEVIKFVCCMYNLHTKTSYYRDNFLIHENNKKNGKKDGKITYHDKYGYIFSLENYKNDKKNGSSIYYTGRGKKNTEKFYIDDIEYSCKYYTTNGYIIHDYSKIRELNSMSKVIIVSQYYCGKRDIIVYKSITVQNNTQYYTSYYKNEYIKSQNRRNKYKSKILFFY